LIAEFNSELADPIVALRGDQRWVRAYEQVALERAAHPVKPIRRNGVYMITGGLTGIGFALAQYLSESFQARLVLVDDAALPERERWPAYLASHSQQDETSRKIVRAEALESKGAQVLAISARLSDVDQMQAAVARAIEEFGDLNGVIHAASAPSDKSFRTISEIELSECDWHFEPKAYALYALEKALDGQPLDFCVVDSSLSAILGGIGYFAYAAANQFVDSFIEDHNKKQPLPWISINWDAWKADEEEQQLANYSPTLAQFAMTGSEGLEVFQRILSSTVAHQFAVSTGDLDARIAQHIKAEPLPVAAQTGASSDSSPLHPRPSLTSAYIAPTNELEKFIAETWQKSLGIRQIGVQDNFFDLGGDSLLAVQVIAQLRKAMNMDIPAVSLYEGVTIKSLAELLKSLQQEQASVEQIMAQGDDRDQRIMRRKEYQQKQRSRKREVAG
jgi:acyl carrier protein/transcriptional regulator with XRE-family HTH domain